MLYFNKSVTKYSLWFHSESQLHQENEELLSKNINNRQFKYEIYLFFFHSLLLLLRKKEYELKYYDTKFSIYQFFLPLKIWIKGKMMSPRLAVNVEHQQPRANFQFYCYLLDYIFHVQINIRKIQAITSLLRHDQVYCHSGK